MSQHLVFNKATLFFAVSVRILESLQPLQYNLALFLPPICPAKEQRIRRDQHYNQNMRSNGDPNSSLISRRLLLSHNEAPSNPTCAVEGRDKRGGEDALPLSGDVVCLVGGEGSPVGDVGACGEELKCRSVLS